MQIALGSTLGAYTTHLSSASEETKLPEKSPWCKRHAEVEILPRWPGTDKPCLVNLTIVGLQKQKSEKDMQIKRAIKVPY